MTQTIHLRISLFGAFRKYADGAILALDVPTGMTIVGLRQMLEQELKRLHPDFQDAALIHDSAFADATRILDDATAFSADADLAVLPPVCGG